jgi:hypothetical protein
MWLWILDVVGCSFALLRGVCWPMLEECYAKGEIWIQGLDYEGFFFSDISFLSDGLGQCRQVPPNLSQCSDAI